MTRGDASGIRIYTDGSSAGSVGGPGGWAAVTYVAQNDDTERMKTISGYETATTNQRMEILAAIKGLESVQDFFSGGLITVYSDSSYLVNCMRRCWYEKWIQDGWVNSRKKPVANRDLWERLLAIYEALAKKGVKVEFRKVRGHTKATHANAEGNRLADSLAVAARVAGREGSRRAEEGR